VGRHEVIVLDTHVLLWVDSGSRSLGSQAANLVQRAWEDRLLSVSAVSFWECAFLHSRRRIVLPLEPHAWRDDLLEKGLLEHALDGGTAILAAELELQHRDPADRFIAATAIARDATLVTADKTLLRWRSALQLQDARR
jgi:PIN domain nuclease of toxin-antitoxin system